MKACPFCAEEIQDAAVVCRHCSRPLTAAAVAADAMRTRSWSPGVAAVLSLLVPGLGQVYKGYIFSGIVACLLTIALYLAIIPGLLVHLMLIADAYRAPSAAERKAKKAADALIGSP